MQETVDLALGGSSIPPTSSTDRTLQDLAAYIFRKNWISVDAYLAALVYTERACIAEAPPHWPRIRVEGTILLGSLIIGSKVRSSQIDTSV